MTTISPTTVSSAATRLAGIVNKTPVLTSRTLNDLTGCTVYLKCENFQRVGAFKFRGAYNALSQLSDVEKAAGVITHSSGNHAQGVALAARLLGIAATVVMPDDAPANKKAATAAYGATIVTCAAVDREQVTADLIARHGYTLIHPYDNDNIIIGQGTAAFELFNEVGELDVLFVPVGGGGLISGSALATAALSPTCRVVGVEPAIADDANQSWRAGEIITFPHVPNTIADGLRTRHIGERNLAVMRQHVHDMVTVSEDDIMNTLQFLWSRLKIVVEPSSAVALAPLFTGQYPLAGKRVGVILSGGNVDVAACGFFHKSAAKEAIAPKAAASSEPAETTLPPTNQPRILVTTELDELALAVLQETAVIDTLLHPSKEELLQRIGDYEAILVDGHTPLSGQVIEYGHKLQAIASTSPWLDNIGVSTARSLGVEIYNAPGSNAVTIAEHTLGRLLRLASKFGDDRLAGKTLGIIGFGHVGKQVARRAQAFDMRILVNQPRLTPELALAAGVEAADLHELLAQSDFVTLHVPFRQETDAIIGQREVAILPSDAYLINTGHTDLVNEAALLEALQNGRLAGAALSDIPEALVEPSATAVALRQHPRVLVEKHITKIIKPRPQTAVIVARELAQALQRERADESLSLQLVPIELVVPHEETDAKRVARLMERLEADGRLVNPPITTYWKGKYVILDGATRFTAFKELGYPHIIVQVASTNRDGVQLHTWYHAISSERPFAELQTELQKIDGLTLTPLAAADIPAVFRRPDALCYFLDPAGNALLATAPADDNQLTTMNQMVQCYNQWGSVERTLLTNPSRLLAQFPQMAAVAIFPQFKPETVFDVASDGRFVPAGLTRFVIPGRILRLNADLQRLKGDEPLAVKRAWFNDFLADKLARSRLRYYQEPVVLLDE